MVSDNSFLPKTNNTTEKKEVKMQTVEVVREFSPECLASILEIDKASFDEQYPDAEEYYREMLEDPKNINIFLKEGEKLIGYLLAIPHDVAREDMKNDDPQMPEDAQRFYVETIEVLPEFRKGRGFLKMILAMIKEAEKRGVNRFSMHTRVENGLSEIIQKYFGRMIKTVRRIEKWPYYGGKEATEYLEGTYDGKR